jgi:hypothetical protein
MTRQYSRRHNAKNGEFALLDRRRVARLYLHGHTQTQIARALGCSQATVCSDLAAVREDWKADARRSSRAKLRPARLQPRPHCDGRWLAGASVASACDFFQTVTGPER